MNRVLLILVCFAIFGCKEDPARSVKIIDRPSEPVGAPAEIPPTAVAENSQPPIASPTPIPSHVLATRPPIPASAPAPVELRTAAPEAEPISKIVTPARAADARWLDDFCPPPVDDSAGPGSLVVSGPCGAQHKAAVRCESSSDDFITAFTQNALNGATLVTYVNVEFYHGPGSYDGTQVFVAVQNRNAIWRWSNDNVHAVVAPGETSVTLSQTRLLAEPMLLNCTRLIGPSTNYQYQCGSRSSAGIVVSSPPEVISGKLQCLRAK